MTSVEASERFYEAAVDKWQGHVVEYDGTLQTVATVSRAPLPVFDPVKSPDAFYTRAVMLNMTSGTVLYGCMHDDCHEVGRTAMWIARTHWGNSHPGTVAKSQKVRIPDLDDKLGEVGSMPFSEVLRMILQESQYAKTVMAQAEMIQSLTRENRFLRSEVDKERKKSSR